MPGFFTVEAEQLDAAKDDRAPLRAEATLQVTIKSFNGFKGYVNMIYTYDPSGNAPEWIAPESNTIHVPEDGSVIETVLAGHSGLFRFVAQGYRGSTLEDEAYVNVV